MRRENRLPAATIGVAALLMPLGAVALALIGAVDSEVVSRISFPFETLSAVTATLGWVRLLATGLLAIPVIAAKP